MNSGIEHAALMISEEKTQHDSRKPSLSFFFCVFFLSFSLRVRVPVCVLSVFLHFTCHQYISVCACARACVFVCVNLGVK